MVFSTVGGKKDANGDQNITPFTTMIKAIKARQGSTFSQAESYLKAQLGIAGTNISLLADYTAVPNLDPYATEKAHLLKMAQVTTQLFADTYASLSLAVAQNVTITNITTSQLIAASVNYVASSLGIINNAVDQYTVAGNYSLANATSSLIPVNTNNATLHQLFVQDTVAPTITAPVDFYAEATAPRSVLSIVPPIVTDLVDPAPSLSNNAPATFPLGTTAVTWTATDANGNTATAIQNIMVRDTTAPILQGLPLLDQYSEATGTQTTVALTAPTATDIFPVTVTSNAPATFPIGTTVVTWTATDAYGNTTTAIQQVIVRDTVAPVVIPPADHYAEATGILTTLAINSATATDLVDVYAVITHNQPVKFPVGNTAVTWTATDFSGNIGTAIQQVTLSDTTPPTITPPANVRIQATGLQTVVTLVAATAIDSVDPNPIITSNAPTTFSLGGTTVVWTATDLYGNSATTSSMIDLYSQPVSVTINAIMPQVSNKGEQVAFSASVVAGSLPISGYQWAMEELINGVPTGNIRAELGDDPMYMTETDLPIGTWRIHFSAWDTYGAISQATPVDITVLDGTALPDLAMHSSDTTLIDDYGTPSTNAQMGDLLHLQAIVHNVGYRDSYAATVTLYDEYSNPLAQRSIPAIVVDGERTFDLSWNIGQDMYGNALINYDNSYHLLHIQIDHPSAEFTTQNNRVNRLLIVGAPPANLNALYAIQLDATASGCVGGIGSLQGNGHYRWGSQIPVMGAAVNVSFFTPYANGINLGRYSAFSYSPDGRYSVAMKMPSVVGMYRARITVFDNNLIGSLEIPVNVHTCPSGYVGGGGGGGGGSFGGGSFTPFTDLAIRDGDVRVTGNGVHTVGNKTHALLNNTLDVYATVYNVGTNHIASIFNVDFYTGDPNTGGTWFGTVPVAGLQAGSNMLVRAPQQWTPTTVGFQKIYAVADHSNVIVESNEYNNTGVLDVYVHAPIPDLRPYYVDARGQRISGLHFSTPRIKQGDIINVVADVFNIGSASAPANSFNVGYDLYADKDGQFITHIGKRLVNPLLPINGVVAASINWNTTNVTPGWYRLQAIADVDAQLAEDSEGNNITRRRVHVYPAQADMWPIAINFSNPTPLKGTAITVTGTVRNDGALTATSAAIDFYTGDPNAGGTWFGSMQSGAVAAFGGTSSKSLIWNAPNIAGLYKVCMAINNRTYCRSIQVLQGVMPNIEILSTDIFLNPFAPTAGNQVTISANIRNIATIDVRKPFVVQFFVDGAANQGIQQVGNDVTVPALAAGFTTTPAMGAFQ